MNDQTDAQLLRAYAEQCAESAFAELVRRHVDLVYSAAVRMVCDSHLAQDVTQGVFVALAKQAPQLVDRPVLSGWLHGTAKNIAAQAVRTDVRRRAREQEAATMNELLAGEADIRWEQIAPHLDAALGELNELDRDALLLRYFERKSAREIAQILNLSDEAAQKRVSRAVERLRDFFSQRNVTIGASGLVVLISANAVQSAPIGLAATISTTAILTGTVVTTSTVITATKTIAMTTLKKTLITAVLATVAGAGIFEARQAALLRDQNQILQQQHASLADQIRQLQANDEVLSNHLAEMSDAKKLSEAQYSELLKLRGKAARLGSGTMIENDPAFQKARVWLAKEARLREQFELHPEQWIPEMKYLSDEEWLDEARKAELDTTNNMRCALSNVRSAAIWKFGSKMSQALQSYLITHDQQLPDSTSQLGQYFHPPIDDVDKILSRYEMLSSEQQADPAYQGTFIVQKQKTLVDHIDNAVLIGTNTTTMAPRLIFPTVIPNELMPVVNAYEDVNHEGFLTIYDIEPYATTPEQKAALNKYMKAATLPR